MLFSEHTFIGVIITPGKKNIQYAAIDDEFDLLALAQGDMNQIMTFLQGQQQATVGIYGPSGLNHGILTNTERRDQYLIPLGRGRPGNMRVAEYTLRKNNLATYRTPQKMQDAQVWMQTSFKLYHQIQEAGFLPYQPEETLPRKYVEVIPENGFKIWLDGKGLPPKTLHGRMQRQMVLYEMGLQIPDPMSYFEEITRFRILQGLFPKDIVHSTSALAALAAAYFAWQVEKQPESLTLVGIPVEGQIAVHAELIARED